MATTISCRPSLHAAEICCHVRQSGSSFTAFGASRHISCLGPIAPMPNQQKLLSSTAAVQLEIDRIFCVTLTRRVLGEEWPRCQQYPANHPGSFRSASSLSCCLHLKVVHIFIHAFIHALYQWLSIHYKQTCTRTHACPISQNDANRIDSNPPAGYVDIHSRWHAFLDMLSGISARINKEAYAAKLIDVYFPQIYICTLHACIYRR